MLTGLKMFQLLACSALTELPESLGTLTRLEQLNLGFCHALKALPASFGALTRLKILNLEYCEALTALPASVGALMGLETLNLFGCKALRELPASLGALRELATLDLIDCDTLHTPPPSIVRAGTGAVLQFLRDLTLGAAPSHLIKVVLLGDQHAGKSSLADSLVLGRPATRADNDRTAGIEVRRWQLGDQSPLVANIYDVAGHRVYRATHGFFMSPGALFLHIVRCDMPEDAAVTSLLEWVYAVQQEASGAVMGIVWTHIDSFTDGVCNGAGGQLGLLWVTGSAGGETASWISMYYSLNLGSPCALKDVGIFICSRLKSRSGSESKSGSEKVSESEGEKVRNKERESGLNGMAEKVRKEGYGCVEAQRHVETEDVRGKVAVCNFTCDDLIDVDQSGTLASTCANSRVSCIINSAIKESLPNLHRQGAVGVVFIIDDDIYTDNDMLHKLSSSLCAAASIPIMLLPERDSGALERPGAKLTAVIGLLLPSCPTINLYLTRLCAKPRHTPTHYSAMPVPSCVVWLDIQCNVATVFTLTRGEVCGGTVGIPTRAVPCIVC